MYHFKSGYYFDFRNIRILYKDLLSKKRVFLEMVDIKMDKEHKFKNS